MVTAVPPAAEGDGAPLPLAAPRRGPTPHDATPRRLRRCQLNTVNTATPGPPLNVTARVPPPGDRHTTLKATPPRHKHPQHGSTHRHLRQAPSPSPPLPPPALHTIAASTVSLSFEKYTFIVFSSEFNFLGISYGLVDWKIPRINCPIRT